MKDKSHHLSSKRQRGSLHSKRSDSKKSGVLSQKELQFLVENIKDLIYFYRLKPERKFEYVNSAATAITGYTAEEHYADPHLGFKLVHPEDRPILESMLINGTFFKKTIVLRWVHKNGHTIWTEQKNEPIFDEAGSLVAIVGIARDITKSKQAEEQLNVALEEKEVLLRETHHRVKNNMQIVLSLLRLQSRQIRDQETVDMLKVSQNRIKSMALIHESLYKSRNLAKIDFSEYLKGITTHLMSIFQLEKKKRIRLTLHVKDVYLDINRAVPCGLIVNELVSNSLKHAFPGSYKGEISIHMSGDQADKYTLTVKDNGVGFPRNLDFRKTETLGLQLVTDLARQLKGTIKMQTNAGTEFAITF